MPRGPDAHACLTIVQASPQNLHVHFNPGPWVPEDTPSPSTQGYRVPGSENKTTLWGTGGGRRYTMCGHMVADGRRWWSCRSCCCMCRMFSCVGRRIEILCVGLSGTPFTNRIASTQTRIESSGRVDSIRLQMPGSDVDVLLCCDVLCCAVFPTRVGRNIQAPTRQPGRVPYAVSPQPSAGLASPRPT